MLMDSSA
jgi:hypothetical protein